VTVPLSYAFSAHARGPRVAVATPLFRRKSAPQLHTRITATERRRYNVVAGLRFSLYLPLMATEVQEINAEELKSRVGELRRFL
jgi:hypothetical protein